MKITNRQCVYALGLLLWCLCLHDAIVYKSVIDAAYLVCVVITVLRISWIKRHS